MLIGKKSLVHFITYSNIKYLNDKKFNEMLNIFETNKNLFYSQ